MVEDPRASARSGAIRHLGLPTPIAVKTGDDGWPTAVRIGRRWLTATVLDCWRIDDEWWRLEPIMRVYVAVLLSDGRRLVLFQDLISEEWFQQHQ